VKLPENAPPYWPDQLPERPPRVDAAAAVAGDVAAVGSEVAVSWCGLGGAVATPDLWDDEQAAMDKAAAPTIRANLVRDMSFLLVDAVCFCARLF
jgi:hypothetical protein